MSGLVAESRVRLLQKGARVAKVSTVVMIILTAIKAVVGYCLLRREFNSSRKGDQFRVLLHPF
jgi:hypothetical protein